MLTLSQVQLSAKQKEAIKNQLAKEAAIRERLTVVSYPLFIYNKCLLFIVEIKYINRTITFIEANTSFSMCCGYSDVCVF